MRGVVMLLLLLASACGVVSDYARTSAVHDGMRALGLAQMRDGTYEFRLCELESTYTPAVLEEKCINPLVTENGDPLVFTEVPTRPGTLVAHGWNWGTTLLAAAVMGAATYGLGRYGVRIVSIKRLSREAYRRGLERSLDASQKYDHFELPQHLRERLLVEGESIGVGGEPVKTYMITNELRLDSAKTVKLRDMLTDTKLQEKKKLITGRKGLKQDEVDEVSKLLTELEESLRSGAAYVQSLEAGLEKIAAEGLQLPRVVEDIVQRSEGKLALKDEVLVALRKNRPVRKEHRAALQRLDQEVARLTGRAANSLVGKQRHIAKLEAATDLDAVLKVVEGVGDEALSVAAQSGEGALRALTEGSLRNAVKELSEIVENSEMVATDVTARLDEMRQQVDTAATAWREIAEQHGEVGSADGDVVKRMYVFIKDTRKQAVNMWRKQAKMESKALQDGFKTPVYKSGADAYEGAVTKAINSADNVRSDASVKLAGRDVVKHIQGELEARTSSKIAAGGDELVDFVDDVNVLAAELEEAVRKVNNFEDLLEVSLKTVDESSLFKREGDAKQLAEELREIVAAAEETAKRGEVGFFTNMLNKVRGFSFKDSKLFRYWDKDANHKAAISIEEHDEVVDRLANSEVVGDVKIKKGLEKMAGHLVAVGTFVAIPITSLRQKLSGHAQISAASRWDSLTSPYDLATAARVNDMRTIIDGIAVASGGKVSDEVFYFLLRSGLTDRR